MSAYQGPSPTLNATPVATLLRYLDAPQLAWDFLALARAGAVGRVLRPRRPAARAAARTSSSAGGATGSTATTSAGCRSTRSWSSGPSAGSREDVTLAAPRRSTSRSCCRRRTSPTPCVRGCSDLHRPDLLARNPLLRTRLARDFAGTQPPDAEALASLLLAAVDVLRRHPRDDKLLRAVERTYVRPAPNQEAAAELLGLPFSTYRRHLSQGVQRVVACLWDHEVYGTTPEPG